MTAAYVPRGALVPTEAAAVTVRSRRCRVRDCDDDPAPTDPWCARHLYVLQTNQRWCPARQEPLGDEGATQTVCALCGTPVWFVRRLDDDHRDLWALETVAADDGRCWIADGGFRVITSPGQLAVLAKDKTPLYRNHVPQCMERPRA